MSLVAIVNLAERLLNQSPQHGEAGPNGLNAAKAANTTNPPTTFDDLFTSSANGPAATAQDAGIFNVDRFAIFSAAADFLLGQANRAAPPPDANVAAQSIAAAGNAAGTQATANAAQTPPTANANTQPPTQAANVPAQTLPLTNTAEITAPTSTAGSAAGSALNTQSQLQALNNALAALGLPATDLTIIDRIASLIQDFNPAAFTSLVYQLEALANSQSPQATPAAQANGPASAAPSSGNLTASGGLRIQELVVRFSAVNETLQSGNPQTGGSTVQFSAFNLQIQGVSLTFANNSGQTIQLQAPQLAAVTSPAANSQARAASA